MGTLLQSLGKIGLFANSSQTIGTKGLTFLGFDGITLGVIIRKFGEDGVKPCPWGFFFFPSKFPGCVTQQNCAKITSSSFSLLLF